MAWRWVENSSSEKPEAIDETSSNSVVYVRKNFIHIEAVEDQNDSENNVPEHWKYQEQVITKEEWPAYYNSIVNSANIDYIAMEVGVDL